MTVVVLTPQERKALGKIASGPTFTPEARRAQALVWLAEGYSTQEVAQRLSVSRQSIYNWIDSIQQRRSGTDLVSCLADKPRSGRPPRRGRVTPLPVPAALDPLLATALAHDPRACGYRSILWTVKLLRQYLYEVHRVKVSAAHVRSALARLENRWQSTSVLADEQSYRTVARG